jgi:uncharacterized membrane protein YvlD (DUF360 family)
MRKRIMPVIRFLISTLAYLIANAIGLLIAVLLLPGFQIKPLAFLLVVAIFSLVQTILEPLLTKLALKRFPQIMGGIALVTIFVGLFVTERIMGGMQIGGISNWLAATLLVWLGSLITSILLPIFVFKRLAEKRKET